MNEIAVHAGMKQLKRGTKGFRKFRRMARKLGRKSRRSSCGKRTEEENQVDDNLAPEPPLPEPPLVAPEGPRLIGDPLIRPVTKPDVFSTPGWVKDGLGGISQHNFGFKSDGDRWFKDGHKQVKDFFNNFRMNSHFG